MTDLVCGEVHSVTTGVAGRHMKERWQQLGYHYSTCVVKIGAQIFIKHVPLQLFAPTQPIPTVQSAMLY